MKKMMLIAALSAAFVTFASATPAFADEPARPAGMPAYAKDKPLPTPHIGKKTLANGLQVWVVPRKGVPRVDMVLAVRGAGYIADDTVHPGFANMLAGLLNEGSARHDSRAIAELAQGLGGSVGGSASADGITVSANAVASQAGPMMQLLAEVARTPSFPAKEVALAKANALQVLRVSETQPRFRADRALNRAVFGEHPYGHTTPTVEAINSVDEALLRTEHTKRFRPDQALLVIAGRIKEADAMKLAQQAFGDWKAEGEAVAGTPRVPATAKP
ncbi:MAG: M16 family metallopeptidase, partial [Ramlibacter sp.]